ncbi:MAG: T9SS type A sorting domain-containing protein, partial [Saprospiraceae bacterium]
SNAGNFGMAPAATTSSIFNKACYPTPVFTNLNGPICLGTEPFEVEVADINGADGTVLWVMINGELTNIFDAGALGEGFYTVMAVFDAGDATQNTIIDGVQVGGSMQDALNDPGCEQKISMTVQVLGTPSTLVCNDTINVSIDADCHAVVMPDDVLEGTYYCYDDYNVILTYPNGTTQFDPPNQINETHIGNCIVYELEHFLSGNVCNGVICVEDKLPPALTCPDDLTIACSQSTDIPFTGDVVISDCSATTTQIDNVVVDNGECGDPRQVITRTFIVTDEWGNQSLCSHTITVTPFALTDVVMPIDITIDCEDAYLNPDATAPGNTGEPSIDGSPIGSGGLCSASINYTDEIFDICAGSYSIHRTWKVSNECLPLGPDNPIEHTQRIRIKDFGGPVFDCPGDITVSVDPLNPACCATAALPDMIISEGCSEITDLEAKITGVDPNTGNITTFTVAGHLGDFPGNNYWNPDTLAIFPYTQCLPNGNTYTVVYTAADECGNISSCEFELTVADLAPPVAVCDEHTQVALGGTGMAFVDASTFDDGSYDNCADVHFKARRMDSNDCQTDTLFHDQVKFCCDDINDTIMVVFRVYDVDVPAGTVGLDDYEPHFNDCMVEVFVEDKIKPVCTAPAHTTVACENFDPSLWAYGFAEGEDNCCLDTITTTTNYALFDTLCNKGTITRTFRVFDCAGNSSQCTQRVVVEYIQDYYVRFPNDVIVNECDGTGTYGEPIFFGEDCEQMGVSFEDEVFTVVPDACYKIERTWDVINWCTYNPNLPLISVPNPNPNATTNHPSNLPGPIVSAPGTLAPWAPTNVKINPTDLLPTNYSTFWQANANGYRYKQIIKIIDTEDPVFDNCPSDVEICDLTANDGLFYNDAAYWDATIESHDLCEAPSELCVTVTDSCGGAEVNIRYLLFLDMDGDGVMETEISSTNQPAPNEIPYLGGTAFDHRPVVFNQKYRFAIDWTTTGNSRTACVRWDWLQQPANLNDNTLQGVVPQLPYGTHKIKWIAEDGCGNEAICEYTFEVKDCKKPTVVCLNGLSVNIMPTGMITLWGSDFLQYGEDNCTPADQLVYGVVESDQSTGSFPVDAQGNPLLNVTFDCSELGPQPVQLWAMDAAGNADFCETYVIVQDNGGFCDPNSVAVAGVLATEAQDGVEDVSVELVSNSAQGPLTASILTDNTGVFGFQIPLGSDYTVTPLKDDNPLNGVTTYDLVLISKHILGLEPLGSPYKMIAADANKSNSITTFDIVEFRKLILGIYNELPNNTSWRFVDEDFEFTDPGNPFIDQFPETISGADIQSASVEEDFVSVKIGDVNGSAIANSLMNTDDRSGGTMLIDVHTLDVIGAKQMVQAGETLELQFTASEQVLGYQFTLNLEGLDVLDIKPGTGMSLDNFGVFADAITTSYDGKEAGAFKVTFRAKQSGSLEDMLRVSSRITTAEAYSTEAERLDVALRFNGEVISGQDFELYQNVPNPWVDKTQIGFYLPEATTATLTIFDESGRVLYSQKGDFAKGYNVFSINRNLVDETGVLYYKVTTDTDEATMKMIQVK